MYSSFILPSSEDANVVVLEGYLLKSFREEIH